MFVAPSGCDAPQNHTRSARTRERHRHHTMTEKTLITNISIINEGRIIVTDLLLDKGSIQKIGKQIDEKNEKVIEGKGKNLFNGIIDGDRKRKCMKLSKS